jgi:hypothetical protein
MSQKRPAGIAARFEPALGGEGGIRTPDTLAGMPHFECGAFDHSATSPYRGRARARNLPTMPCLRKSHSAPICAQGYARFQHENGSLMEPSWRQGIWADVVRGFSLRTGMGGDMVEAGRGRRVREASRHVGERFAAPGFQQPLRVASASLNKTLTAKFIGALRTLELLADTHSVYALTPSARLGSDLCRARLYASVLPEDVRGRTFIAWQHIASRLNAKGVWPSGHALFLAACYKDGWLFPAESRGQRGLFI